MYSKCDGLGDLVRELKIDRNLNEIDVSEILFGRKKTTRVPREEIERDDLEKFSSLKISRQNPNEVDSLILKLPFFATNITDNNLLETTYGILLACAFENLLVPSKEKEKFSDKKAYIWWQKRRLKMLTEEITNDPTIVFEKYLRMTNEFRILLEKIEKYAAFPPSRGEVQMDTAITLVEMPARVHLTREVGHWTYGYHLNDRLYEELLVSVFDVLDEGKLTKDMEEILELFARYYRPYKEKQ
ncbi:hypothetical protein V6N13_058851 [Hibiscus sabdariffa]